MLSDQRALASLQATTETTCPCTAAVLRYIVPFLERYLGGRDTAAPLLGPPTGPGFVYQSDLQT